MQITNVISSYLLNALCLIFMYADESVSIQINMLLWNFNTEISPYIFAASVFYLEKKFTLRFLMHLNIMQNP